MKEFIMSLLSGIVGWFKRTPQEQKEIQENTIEQGVELARAEEDIKDVKRQAKLERRLDRKEQKEKKPLVVTKLKPNKSTIRIKDGDDWLTATYSGHNDKEVIDTQGKRYEYGSVYNYHMKLIIKEVV